MGHDQGEDDSVFDFLYIDSQRIALFLSQFGQYGHLTALTKSATISSTREGGVDVKLAKFEGSEGEQSTLSEQFSAQWVAPLTFLDEADQRRMIVRGLQDARIGQLVLAEGSLEVRDLTIIKKAFALPAMKDHIASQSTLAASNNTRQARRRNERAREQRPKKEFSPEQFGLEFLGELPHALHASLRTGHERIWCSLREDSLLVSAADLFLKHGVKISGHWNMLGILDALPDSNQPVTDVDAQSRFDEAQQAIPQGELSGLMTVITQGFGGLIDGIAPLARMFLGRHADAYGLTPLMIFREVAR